MATLYQANDSYSATLTAGYTVGQNTLSVTAVPTNLPTIVTVGYNTDKETHFIVTGSSGGNTLTGVSRLKGANVNLDNLTPLTCLNLEDFQNQYLTMISSVDTLSSAIFGADGGSTDDYVVTLSPAPASLTTGLMLIVKFNTLNTGPATINVNSLGAKDIKKYGSQALVTGDIIANQVSILVYDGTNFQLIGDLNNFLTEHNTSGTHKGATVTTLKATGAEINTGTEDAKIVTPKAIADSNRLPSVDQDDMADNSDTKVPTQQSVKAYVDSGTVIMTNKTLTSPIVSGAGGITAGQYGYDATDKTILIGNGAANQIIFTSAWKAYTPSFTNLTVGSGVLDFKYCQIGKKVEVEGYWRFGAGSAVGLAPYFTLPITASTLGARPTSYDFAIEDSGSAFYVGKVRMRNSTTAILVAVATDGIYASHIDISATIPITWTINDSIYIHFSYEAA